MTDCPHRKLTGQAKYCNIAEQISGIPVQVMDEHCSYCSNSEYPNDINNVTVSVAISAVYDQDPTKARELVAKYSSYIRYNPTEAYPCKNRSEIVGSIDCKCQGNNHVYKCKVHGLSAIRKLTPGIPTVKIGSDSLSRDMSYCNGCLEINDEATIFSTCDPDHYHSYEDLLDNAKKLASNVARNEKLRGIVGIPRSGMLAAAAMAVHLGVPLYYVDDNLDVRPVPSGARLFGVDTSGRLLVVDDSANSGNKISTLRNKLGTRDYIYSAVYTTKRASKLMDYAQVELELPHWFEWWLYGSPLLYDQQIATDFDGIICEDCPIDCDDDGPKYIKWMMEVKPIRHFYPHGIPYAITARIEKYKDLTRKWVNENQQVIAKIIHAPYKSKEERSLHNISEFKAKTCLSLGVKIFIESEPIQAMEIAAMTNLPVICPKMKKVLNHNKGNYIFK